MSGKAAAAALLLAASGCGYRFTAGAAPLPEGIRSVCAPVYKNRTAEPGLEALFSESMREWLSRSGVSATRCEATLEGEIASIAGAQTLLTPAGTLASYRVSAVVQLKLVKGGRVVAQAEVGGAEDYLPAPAGDVLVTEANRQAAIRRLSDALARDGYERLAGGW
ncbi:MAG TPA: LPS assembly lipoprotein LptE [Myxococcaceae bacterium]